MLTAPRRLEWQAQDLSGPGPGEILVQTTSGAISSGSELPRYLGTARGDAATYPAMTGYESVGVVLACGSDVSRIAPGDLAHAERLNAFFFKDFPGCAQDRAAQVAVVIGRFPVF